MRPASAKAKGRHFQQWVVKLLYDIYDTLEEGDIRSTAMGQNGEDIQMSPAARRLIPFSIECKASKAIAVYKWMEQAKANAPKGAEPIVVMKQDRCRPLVLVDAEWFFNKVRKD